MALFLEHRISKGIKSSSLGAFAVLSAFYAQKRVVNPLAMLAKPLAIRYTKQAEATRGRAVW